MKVYFLSSIPCALKINGAYLGKVDGFERFAELFPANSPFVEFLPFGEFLPLRFSLTETLFSAPPKSIDVYRSDDFIVLYAKRFSLYPKPLKLLLEGSSYTVYFDGSIKVILPDKRVYETAFFEIPHTHAQDELLILQEKAENTHQKICVFFKGSLLFDGAVFHFEHDEKKETFSFVAPLKDIACRRAEFVYSLKEQAVLTSFKVKESLPVSERFLPCDFLQRLPWDDGAKELLSDNLKEDFDALKNYLGEYAFAQPLATPFCVLLGERQGKNIFRLKTFQAELTNGKISDFSRKS